MSKSNRNAPKRAKSSESTYTFMDFEREFPDDRACLDFLLGHLYPEGIFCPKDQRVTKHHRVKSRTCYECQYCGHQEYPMAGTIFQDSATSLRLWFHAFFLMAQTRCGISAKQLERELGVTYKTAWRMFKKIRSLLYQDDGEPLSGTVEADEAYLGPNARWMHERAKRERNVPRGGTHHRTTVMGMAKRRSADRTGRVVAKIVPSSGEPALVSAITTHVLPATAVYTDEFRAYDRLSEKGYAHSRINHSQGVYVSGDVHTNTPARFWLLRKSGIRGAYP